MPFQIKTFESLGYRDYRLLWLSATTSSTGQFYKTVVVGWLTYNVTGSPILTALSFGLESLPNLISNPIGGVLADRVDKRILMVGSSIYNCLLTIGFSALLLVYNADAWHILTYVLLIGIGMSLGSPAKTSYVPEVVPEHALLNAFSLLSVAYNIAKLVGPAVAGIMISVYGPGRSILVAAGLMLTSAGISSQLRNITSKNQTDTSSSIYSQILEAASTMAKNPVVVALFLTQVIVYGIMAPVTYGLLPVYAADIFAVGPTGLGILTSSLGIGAIIGVLLTASVGSSFPRGIMALVTLGISGLAMIALANTNSFYLAIVTLGIFNAGLVSLTAIKSSGIQSLVPSHLRGRVASITTMSNGALPIGSFVFGTIAQLSSAPTSTIVAASFVFASILGLYVRYPQLVKFQ